MSCLRFTITPRIGDTDFFGHINNTVYPVWFEIARKPIIQMFSSDLSLNQVPLIMLHLEVDFLAETFWHKDVEIVSGIEKIGNSSVTLRQEVWQDNRCRARGKAVFAYYDPELKKTVPLENTHRTALEAVFWES